MLVDIVIKSDMFPKQAIAFTYILVYIDKNVLYYQIPTIKVPLFMKKVFLIIVPPFNQFGHPFTVV